MYTDENSFLNDARNIIDDNAPIARFNETIRNVEKLKANYISISEDNKGLFSINENLKKIVVMLDQNNSALTEHIAFLEEILNNLQIIVSIKDTNKNNLLWYNDNYKRILGYRHRDLQGLNSTDEMEYYHPEDRSKIADRKRVFISKKVNRHTCTLRMKHKSGNWVALNSDLIVLKRNPDGTSSRALEVLSVS